MSLLQVSNTSGVTILSFIDSKFLDEESICQVGEEFLAAAKQAIGGRLVVDFQRVAFMSSEMIRQVMRLRTQAISDETDLKLCGIPDLIMDAFKLTKLNEVLEIYPTIADALASFDSPTKKKGWFGR